MSSPSFEEAALAAASACSMESLKSSASRPPYLKVPSEYHRHIDGSRHVPRYHYFARSQRRADVVRRPPGGFGARVNDDLGHGVVRPARVGLAHDREAVRDEQERRPPEGGWGAGAVQDLEPPPEEARPRETGSRQMLLDDGLDRGGVRPVGGPARPDAGRGHGQLGEGRPALAGRDQRREEAFGPGRRSTRGSRGVPGHQLPEGGAAVLDPVAGEERGPDPVAAATAGQLVGRPPRRSRARDVGDQRPAGQMRGGGGGVGGGAPGPRAPPTS